MRIINFLLAVVFLVLAFNSIDQPRPAVWILVYGAMALVAVMAMFELYLTGFIVVLLLAFVAYSLSFLKSLGSWSVRGDFSALFNEALLREKSVLETRYFFQLVLCEVVLVLYLLRKLFLRPANLQVSNSKEKAGD